MVISLIDEWRFLMQCRLRDRRSRLFSLGLRPCPLRTEIPPDSLNLLIMLCTVEGEISKSLPIFLWGTLFLNISIIFSRICWQTGDPRPIFAPKGLDLSWMLLLYQIIITITCWHQLFQITSLFNQFTSLLALNCSCPNFFWNVLQVWMTGKDVYLQMTWSWPDKTWNILCSYCLQWNTSQSKFRNHYFLFLFAFSILSQLFLIWGCIIIIEKPKLLQLYLVVVVIEWGIYTGIISSKKEEKRRYLHIEYGGDGTTQTTLNNQFINNFFNSPFYFVSLSFPCPLSFSHVFH